MKYKVIGWTYYEDYSIPSSDKTIGFAERNAIIDEIRKHNYLFTGWDHQESWENCVPILNDGKKRMFSQRGWGGVMAEAYGEMDDYSYSAYTFHGCLKSSACKYSSKQFSVFDFKSEPLENEHFDVNVSQELFNIAKKSNPFYLEDEDSLRFLDENDTITLHCNNETLTFFVADVNRNKKEVKFSKHHLIKGKYKVIVTHKPIAKVYVRKPLMILRDDANEVFKECVKEYDFNTLYELLDAYDLSILTNNKKGKRIINTLKKFANEYSEYAFNSSLLNKVLLYINDFEFSKEISYKVVKYNPGILISCVNYYFHQGVNVDDHILKALKYFKGDDFYIIDLLLRAIEINPTNKSLRKRYYKAARIMNSNGFILYMGVDEIKSLSKEHKRYVELDDFNSLNSGVIHRIAQFMSYPNYDVTNDEKYGYRAPTFFNSPYKCIKEGILKYQKYVNEKYNLSDRMEELLLIGINKACSDYTQYLDGQEGAAVYVYALDALTGFKYNLKEKAIEKYPDLKDYLEDRYNK